MSWTDKEKEFLRAHYGKMSASQIAVELGKTSRNSVIGKAHQIGLTAPRRKLRTAESRGEGSPRKTRGRATTQRANWSMPRPSAPRSSPVPLPVENSVPPPEQRCSLLELTAHTCRWPYGDPKDGDFYFCGGTTREEESYCPVHVKMSRRSVALDTVTPMLSAVRSNSNLMLPESLKRINRVAHSAH